MTIGPITVVSRTPAQASSSAGVPGPPGPQGPTGPTGGAGPTGPQGNPTTVNSKSGASITLIASDVGAAASTTTITAGAGLTGGGDLSANRTIASSRLVNNQTGTSYTVLIGDQSTLVTFNNAAAVAVSLPIFSAGWDVDLLNLGAGTVTVTAGSGTINGGASIVLSQGQGAHVFSNGANAYANQGAAVGTGVGNVFNSGTPTSGQLAQWVNATTIQGVAASSLNHIKTVQQTVVTTAGSGTYTPATGMVFCIIEATGAGGGSAGIPAGVGGNVTVGGAGGGGSYSRSIFSSSVVNAPQGYTVGAAGTAGVAGINPGGGGSTTSFGSGAATVTAPGGSGGQPVGASALSYAINGGLGGGVGTGQLTIAGMPGGISVGTNSVAVGGNGGAPGGHGGGGGAGGNNGGGTAGTRGGGGGATVATGANSATAGAAGGAGMLIITEFLNQ